MEDAEIEGKDYFTYEEKCKAWKITLKEPLWDDFSWATYRHSLDVWAMVEQARQAVVESFISALQEWKGNYETILSAYSDYTTKYSTFHTAIEEALKEKKCAVFRRKVEAALTLLGEEEK